MRPFEEWMTYQAKNLASLADDELSAWRSAYDASHNRNARGTVWTPRVRANAKHLLYAVAVRDAFDLWLALWVKRSAKGEYFVMLPRDESGWDPHASYHSDGRLHQKSHDQKTLVSQRQVPGPAFKGTEQMLTTRLDLASVCAVKARSDPAQFTGVLEISGGILRQGGHTVAVDLTEANGSALEKPWSQIVMQRRFAEAVPEVLLTVWRYDGQA